MSATDPYFEVDYYQETFPTGAPDDPFSPVDEKNPPESWTYGAVLKSEHFHRLFRVRNGFIQRLTVVGHHADAGYYLYLPQNPVVALVQ